MDDVVDGVASPRADFRGVGQVGVRARLSVFFDRADEPLDRVVEELDVIDDGIGEPDLDGLRSRDEPVLLE